MNVTSRFLSLALLPVFCLAGCHSTPVDAPQGQTDAAYKVYHLRGKVISSDAAHGLVMIDHEAIPGFMDAMTMPYQLKDSSIASELHPGDVITADVLVSKTSEQTVLLDHIVVVAQAKPDYKPAVQYHVPQPGDAVPDFRLKNQDGHALHLAQFRGKMILITFIYTRCPLPNFCPLVTRNFAAINRQLASDPGLYAKVHLVSVSFDSDHDTPERLRDYGEGYIGSDAKTAFSHWDFATGPKADLKKMAEYFDVGLSYNPDGTITHTLSTTLIGPDGKVAAFYPGNDWTPGQVIADIQKLNAHAG